MDATLRGICGNILHNNYPIMLPRVPSNDPPVSYNVRTCMPSQCNIRMFLYFKYGIQLAMFSSLGMIYLASCTAVQTWHM